MKTIAVLASIAVSLCATQMAVAFDPHEHKKASDAGANEAFETTHPDLRLPMKKSGPKQPWVRRALPGDGIHAFGGPPPVVIWAGNQTHGGWFTFGDLVAIYGDLREHVKCDAKKNDCDLGHHSKFKHLRELTREAPHSRLGFSKECLADAECRGFLNGALFNKTHFSHDAVTAYRDLHRTALRHIAHASKTGDMTGVWRALHFEALACHSLTDLFAAGHLVINRSKSVSDTYHSHGFGGPELGLLTAFSSKGAWQGAGEGKLHNMINESGADVTNLEDPHKVWKSFGDDFMSRDAHLQTRVKNAVERSLKSLLHAYAAFEHEKKSQIDEKLEELSHSGATFSALRLIPIRYKNICLTIPTPKLDLPGTALDLKGKKKICNHTKLENVPHHNLVVDVTTMKPRKR